MVEDDFGNGHACTKTNSGREEAVYKKARNDIRKLFYFQAFGQILSLGGLLAVQMMQTSLNVEGRIGAITVTTAFVVTLIVCLFVCPILLQRLQPDTTLILSEVGFLIFCASNFYPKLQVLLPGAIFYGIGRALFVPSYSMLLIKLTAHCAMYSNSRSQAYYFDQFQSKYYSINEGVQIVGNGLSYGIFYGTYQSPIIYNETDVATPISNTTNITNTLYHYCGKNDCQEESIIARSINQYVPPSKTSVYIFIMSTVVLNLFAIFIHCTIFPGVGTFSHKLSKLNTSVKRRLSISHDNQTNSTNSCSKTKESNGDDIFTTERSQAELATESEGLVEDCLEQQQTSQEIKAMNGYWNTLGRTFRFMIGGRAILLGIAALHTGMLIGFAFADVTRAYASCLAGVQMTGGFAICFGIAGMISSWIYGKILPYFGRVSIFAAFCTLEVAVYALCYFWEPDVNATYVVFIIFIGLGLVNGVIRQNLIAAYTIHFAKKKTVALTAFNTAYVGGMGVQYALSTFMCVSSKLIVQVIFTVLALVCYVIAELMGKSRTMTTVKN